MSSTPRAERPSRPRERTLGRPSSAEAERVSRDLRTGSGDLLRRRRRAGALSLSSMASLGVVTAYQLGLFRHLPEPPVGVFDADRVDASGEAYQFLKTPDGALGLASYAATLALVGMGSARRAQERPWVPIALAVKVAADVASSVFLTAEQVSRHRRLCSWCVGAAATSVAMVPQVVPEARLAWGELMGRRG